MLQFREDCFLESILQIDAVEFQSLFFSSLVRQLPMPGLELTCIDLPQWLVYLLEHFRVVLAGDCRPSLTMAALYPYPVSVSAIEVDFGNFNVMFLVTAFINCCRETDAIEAKRRHKGVPIFQRFEGFAGFQIIIDELIDCLSQLAYHNLVWMYFATALYSPAHIPPSTLKPAIIRAYKLFNGLQGTCQLVL